jgi:hypothetical protein
MQQLHRCLRYVALLAADSYWELLTGPISTYH